MNEADLRTGVIRIALATGAERLNRGTSGNVSAREGNGFLITPTGMAYDALTNVDIAFVDAGGTPHGPRKPSSEWRMHHDLYRARPEAMAVVHAHPPFATALACLGMEIPAFHYMIAKTGGNSIRCAPYATFGTQLLSDNAVRAMEGRKACLLANHGLLAFGDSLADALSIAVEVESLCEQYWRALQIGPPVILSDVEMDFVLEKFKTYGK